MSTGILGLLIASYQGADVASYLVAQTLAANPVRPLVAGSLDNFVLVPLSNVVGAWTVTLMRGGSVIGTTTLPGGWPAQSGFGPVPITAIEVGSGDAFSLSVSPFGPPGSPPSMLVLANVGVE